MIFETGKIYYYDGSNWGEIGSSSTDIDVFTLSTATSMTADEASLSLSSVTVPGLTVEQLSTAITNCQGGKIIRLAWSHDSKIDYYNCQVNGEILSFVCLDPNDINLFGKAICYQEIGGYVISTYRQMLYVGNDLSLLTISQSLTSEQQAQVLSNLGVVDAQNISY